MEELQMKLVNLKIVALHGHYDYNVDFNSDVTFIYGENGCGKTTILNILEIITTGRLFKLFDYNFNTIILTYAPGNKLNETRRIEVYQTNTLLKIVFNGKPHEIRALYDERTRFRDRRDTELEDIYFHENSFLIEIRHTFNHVYLPLNRVTKVSSFRNKYAYAEDTSISRISLESDLGTSDRDMLQIEWLVRNRYAEIMSSISRINDQFRNDIMKSLLDVNQTYNFEDIISDYNKNQENLSMLQKTKTSYIKILQELGILSSDESNDYNAFFDGLINEFKEFASVPKNDRILNILFKWQEVLKIKKLVSIVENMEAEKADVRKPIELFIRTINDFIGATDDGKTINIDNRGLISFSTKIDSKPVSIQYLSSGEKQIVTFFAYLMFMVKRNKFGIFVVDEPELSLHLSWQNIFVQKTLQVNDKIQLIFATHSPEFVGHYRNKMFRLERNFTDERNRKSNGRIE